MPKLSYCCIFKDEEKNLPRWIKSAKAVCSRKGDEIIAVDTGSSDMSCQILREAKIEPLYFEWINDFSAAKNFALSKATGDWILFLDADEYFEQKSLKRVRAVIDKIHPDKSIQVIEIVMKNIDPADNRVISILPHWRIFRNLPDLKYIKKIHEGLYYSGKDELKYFKSDLLALHTGYAADISEQKNERNLKLLNEQLKNMNNKPDDSLAFYLANAYYKKGDTVKAKEFIELALKLKTAVIEKEIVKLYMMLISIEKDASKLENIVEESLKAVPYYPELLYEKIKILLPQGKYEEVQKTLDLFFIKIKDTAFVNSYENNVSFIEPYVYLLQAELYWFKKDVKAAQKAIKLAKKLFPNHSKISETYERYTKA